MSLTVSREPHSLLRTVTTSRGSCCRELVRGAITPHRALRRGVHCSGMLAFQDIATTPDMNIRTHFFPEVTAHSWPPNEKQDSQHSYHPNLPLLYTCPPRKKDLTAANAHLRQGLLYRKDMLEHANAQHQEIRGIYAATVASISAPPCMSQPLPSTSIIIASWRLPNHSQ